MIDYKKHYTTEELAHMLGVTAQGIRAALCRKKSYHGLAPVKMPSGQLLWDIKEVQDKLFPNAKVTGSPALSASPCGLPG